jgi:hypothetical protein
MTEDEAKTTLRSCWQLPHTVPKDGTIVLTYFDDMPVFACWMPAQPEQTVTRKRLFRKPETIVKRHAEAEGLRVLIQTPEGTWATHGNYRPFRGDGWMPLPGRPMWRARQTGLAGRP